MGGRRREGDPDTTGDRARARLVSGVPGLDEVLGGGMLVGGTYLIAGGPGTGKTVMANQVCFEHARRGARALYITMLAESHSRMIRNLESLAFFDASLLSSGVAYLSGGKPVREGGLEALCDLLEEEIRRRRPEVLVLDGLRVGCESTSTSEADGPAFLNRLAALLEFGGCTALVCTVSLPGAVAPEYALADGLIELTHGRAGRRAVRELFVVKLRGSNALEGSHVLQIDERGIVVYPRTEARVARRLELPRAAGERYRFGAPGVDDMLSGGIPSASTTAIVGATGAGKTLLGLHFLAEGAKQDQRGLYFGFNESPARVIDQGEGIGLDLGGLRASDLVDVMWERPFENVIDRLVAELLDYVRRRNVRRLYIDGAEGLARSSMFPERTYAVFAALSNELRALGVTTLVSLESEILGAQVLPAESWSALVENTIVLRYVEFRSRLRRLIWIVKLRGSDFESSLREFTISSKGIEVHGVFESAEAVLSGIARVGNGPGDEGGA